MIDAEGPASAYAKATARPGNRCDTGGHQDAPKQCEGGLRVRDRVIDHFYRTRSAGPSAILLVFALVWLCTINSIQPFPPHALELGDGIIRLPVTDRRGEPLAYTFENRWNLSDRAKLHDVPELLRQAFIIAEDKRFYSHRGVDWKARASAVTQTVSARRFVRGASTITEQVVRLLHPRPRTIWSRWVEGFEARMLERSYSKSEILEFYLNQVPYGRRRRGVVQAARMYFDRDLDTLAPHEMLALAVLVRAPSRLDLQRIPGAAAAAVGRLAAQLSAAGYLAPEQNAGLVDRPLELRDPGLPVEAPHFLRALRAGLQSGASSPGGVIRSSLDAHIQREVKLLLDTRIHQLEGRWVHDGAAVVLDNSDGAVLAWVNAGDFSSEEAGSQIDAVLTPRQPGSTLKPFVYAMALEKGWTGATIIDDSPMVEAVGLGLHRFRNYSRNHYGPIRLREALGNSLNIPAVRAVGFVGVKPLLQRLHALGFDTLDRRADFYGEGLALGNGEVTLLELAGAYRALAQNGRFSPPRFIPGGAAEGHSVFSEEAASLIADILSDPVARRREFGGGELLRFPVQTAIKTGTSTDYRDAWAMGFSERYTVGVWMGNLDRDPMSEVTGSIGPAITLRAIFGLLERDDRSSALFLSPRLAAREICAVSGKRPGNGCPQTTEWFEAGHGPEEQCNEQHRSVAETDPISAPRIELPTPGLQMAMDPRIPDPLEQFVFVGSAADPEAAVEWIIDGVRAPGERHSMRYPWALSRGTHSLVLRVRSGGEVHDSPPVAFLVH